MKPMKCALLFSAAVFCSPFICHADFLKVLEDVNKVLDSVSEPSVGEVCVAKDFVSGKPEGIGTTFPASTRKIHVCYAAGGNTAGAKAQAVWLYQDGGAFKKIAEMGADMPKSGSMGEFHLEIAQGANWPEGEYRVDLLIKGELVKSASFKIDDTLTSTSGTGAVWSGRTPGSSQKSQAVSSQQSQGAQTQPQAQQQAQPAAQPQAQQQVQPVGGTLQTQSQPAQTSQGASKTDKALDDFFGK